MIASGKGYSRQERSPNHRIKVRTVLEGTATTGLRGHGGRMACAACVLCNRRRSRIEINRNSQPGERLQSLAGWFFLSCRVCGRQDKPLSKLRNRNRIVRSDPYWRHVLECGHGTTRRGSPPHRFASGSGPGSSRCLLEPRRRGAISLNRQTL